MTDDVVLETQVDETEYSPKEVQAMQGGWRPLEEWDGDPDDWKDAKTFLRDGELMDRIKGQSEAISKYKSKIELLEESFNKLSEHHSKVAEIEYEKALKSLKRQKVEALREEDHDSVIEIDDQITELKLKNKELKEAPPSVVDRSPVEDKAIVNAWFENPANAWYHEDFELQDEANRYYMFLERRGDLQVKDMLAKTEQHIKQKHADKFGQPTRSKTQKVTEPTKVVTKATSTKKYTEKDLSDDERQIAREFVKRGAVKDTQAYIDQLTETGYFNQRSV